MKHRFLSLFLFLSIFILLLSPAQAANPVGVSIDGTAVSFTESSGIPFIDPNSRTLVPLRVVMEQYGCVVGWDKATNTASVTQDDTTVLVSIGKKQIQINDVTIAIDAAAQIKEGRTYLPIRAVLEAFGASVGWDSSTRTVTVLHPANAGLRVHFIDVGQADCILITAENDAMLIDAGNNEDAETITTYLRAHGITHLKYAVGTHPHEDHIGSLDAILYNLSAQNVLMPNIQTNTKTFEDVLDAVALSGLTIYAPKLGDTFSLGNATITTVSNYTGDDLNNSSIMLRLTYGDTSFLFTGDAETKAEEAALLTGLPLDSDVLKVGHHGSGTSSSFDFLSAVSPSHAVISCGKNNDYGHPHAETLQTLAAFNATICRTDMQGTLLAICDGSTISWSNPGIPSLIKSQTSNSNNTTPESPAPIIYVLNNNTMKFHYPSCHSVAKISAEHRADTSKDRTTLLSAGYSPCGICKP